MAQSMAFCNSEWGYIASGISSTSLLDVCFKRKFRWKLIIPGVSADGIDSLPPLKSARPNLSFKEMSFEHLNETISFPGKAEWKPLDLVLYDLDKGIQNPVFTWLRRQYDPTPSNCAYWKPCLETPTFKPAQISLVMFDGCGNVQEIWVYEHPWPATIDFGDLDMVSSDVVTANLTLRYDRAYIEFPVTVSDLPFPSVLTNFGCSPSSVSFVPPSFIPFAETMEVNPPEFKQIRWN